MSTYALILAGGEGTRFAPLSTPACPKQFLALVSADSLIQQTAQRVAPLIDAQHCIVATNAKYLQLVQEHLPSVPVGQVIGETQKKNTAPAIALAAAWLHQRDPNAVMVVLPSDHVILNVAEYHRLLQQAITVATQEDVLVTLGIQPTWPSPEYGYIHTGAEVSSGVYTVQRFVEKPNPETAAQYMADGHYCWNSGMFVWRVSVVMAEIAQHLPDMYRLLQSLNLKSAGLQPTQVADFFSGVHSISIDYGIMEKSQRVRVIPGEFGWNDVGTWQSLQKLVKTGAVQVSSTVQNYLNEYASA